MATAAATAAITVATTTTTDLATTLATDLATTLDTDLATPTTTADLTYPLFLVSLKSYTFLLLYIFKKKCLPPGQIKVYFL